MAERRRLGFTLVELLVVVVIIALLMGLLLPAVINARATARQSQCSNNQKEVGLALQQYEVAKGHYPGYVNSLGDPRHSADPRNRPQEAWNLSWVVMILPHLGREDAWAEWRQPFRSCTYQQKRANVMLEIPHLICPSNAAAQRGGGLSYVVNCGVQDRGIEFGRVGEVPWVPWVGSGRWRYEGPQYGVFLNHFDPSLASRCRDWDPIMVSSDGLADGAQHTLMLSENIQATLWAPPLEASGTAWTGYTPATQCAPNPLDFYRREAHVGMVWWTTDDDDPNANSIRNYYLPAGGDPNLVARNCYEVNNCRDEEPSSPEILLARPSSYHTDGVVVTYCDGRQEFVLDDIEYEVFRRQMAPNDDEAGLPP
jgi:prepilin-type N-terminal cleavage/methylation domain-containing protein